MQPTPLTAAEITPEFGVTWLEPDDIAGFVADHDGGDITVRYHPPTGIWSYDGWAPGGPARFRTDRYTMAEQVMRACNAKPVTVHIKQQVGDREITVIDPEATAAEQLCRDNLTEALQVWCWADPERATRLAGRYNRLFNRYRAEQWDGSHLTLPGLAADFTPRPHQKDVVWRILASADRGVLMAHGVGAGKTAAMIIAAQETRRTGRIAGTALFAVPGNMVEQFARDYLRLYPAARVLTPHGATQKDAVREFAARMATGDFDAAICSHNQLKTIPLSPDVEQRGTGTAARRLLLVRPGRDAVALRGPAVGPSAREGTGPTRRTEDRPSRTRRSPTSTAWASGCSSSTRPTSRRTFGLTPNAKACRCLLGRSAPRRSWPAPTTSDPDTAPARSSWRPPPR